MTDQNSLVMLNLEAWSRGKSVVSMTNLDSNIKKNTAFIKKCKTGLSADSKQQLLNDIQKLSLAKYISEIVSAVVEGLAKAKTTADIEATGQVLSALHQRFPDTFTPLLTFQLAKLLASPTRQELASLSAEAKEREEATRVQRQRVYIRIVAHLWWIGVLRNVSDGVASIATTGESGVAHKDSVAGFTAPATTPGKVDAGKDGAKDAQKGFLYSVLKELMVHDLDQHINLPIFIAFLKHYGVTLLKIVPRKQQAAVEQHDAQPVEGIPMTNDAVTELKGGPSDGQTQQDPVVTTEIQSALIELHTAYFKSVSKHLVRAHKHIKEAEARNDEILIAKGDLSEERQQRYEKATRAYEKLLASTETMADCLNLEMPTLPKEEEQARVSIISQNGTTTVSTDHEPVGAMWEDEDSRSFYQNLANLRDLLPGVLLNIDAKKSDSKENDKFSEKTAESDTRGPENVNDAEEGNDDARIEEDMSKLALEVKDDTAEGDTEADGTKMDEDDMQQEDEEEEADDPESSAKTTQGAQFEALLARLPNISNRDLIDTFAVDFCYHNTKGTRKRLVKTLLGVPRSRTDLLPYYGRLIATLAPYFPDIVTGVLEGLEGEFRFLQKKKIQELAELRVKNIRFLAELTKFRVIPSHVPFHCFKVMLDDFSNVNIEAICVFLEACGRFLLKSPDSSQRMSTMLDMMMRKKNTSHHLDSRQHLMIENAYYQANPPETSAIVVKQRSPLEQYIRKLIYSNLTKKSLDHAFKTLRKLDWNDEATVKMVFRIFAKIWKIKYSNLHLMAILASGLIRYHSDFGVMLIDHVMEEIRIGLEQNIFKHNQRRISTVKYLGELYNYRVVESPVIFDTLYTIITFGHEFGRPARERISPLDAPTDFFRVRLCCTLLDTCGLCFDHGSAKKKLDDFLVFLQMYILSKAKPPLDVEYMISDTFELLRPDMKIYDNYEEVNEQVDLMLLAQLKSQNDGKVDDGFEDEELSGSESDEDDEREIPIDPEDDVELDTQDQEQSGDQPEEDVVVMTKKTEHIPDQDDELFEQEFTKMMSESTDARKHERKPATLDVAIPMHLLGGQGLDRRSLAAREQTNGSSMAFSLLTKRGNRPQIRTMEVPSDSTLAINTRTKQDAVREEQQQLKKLVLNYEQREEATQRELVEQQRQQRLQQRNRRIFHTGGGGGHAYAHKRES